MAKAKVAKVERRTVRGISATEAVAKRANERRARMAAELETRLSFLAIGDVLTEGLADLADEIRPTVADLVGRLMHALAPDDYPAVAEAPKVAPKVAK